MEYAIVQLFVFLVFCGTDAGFAIYRHWHDMHDQVGYVAHLCGAVAGLLVLIELNWYQFWYKFDVTNSNIDLIQVGIGVLRNLKVRPWERKLWWCAVTLYFLLMITGISIHLFYKDPLSDQRLGSKDKFDWTNLKCTNPFFWLHF